MDGHQTKTLSQTKKNGFAQVLINALNVTNYEGTCAIVKSSKRMNELKSFDSLDRLQPFVDWFSNCITKDNCVTSDELEMYNFLKMNGKLVPDENLDDLIDSYFNQRNDLSVNDYESSLYFASMELEALESLEKLILKSERIKAKNELSNFDLSTSLNKELDELVKLNTNYNEVLEQYANSWKDLRENCCRKQLGSKSSLDGIIKKFNSLNKEIEHNINHHLKHGFKEVNVTNGKLQINNEGFCLIFNKFKSLREEIINATSQKMGISELMSQLDEFSALPIVQGCGWTIDEIRNWLCKGFTNELQKILISILKEEINGIFALRFYNTNKGLDILNNRLERLVALKRVLRQKKIYNDTFIIILSRSKVIYNFQYEKLSEFSKNIEMTISGSEQRKKFMSSPQLKQNDLDINYMVMINNLSVQNADLISLDKGISVLLTNINRTYEDLQSGFYKYQVAVQKRLKVIEDWNKAVFEGPTREAFSNMFDNFIDPIKSAQKSLRTMENKVNNIDKMFHQLQNKDQSEKECVWMKCLADPEDFVMNISCMTEELAILMKEAFKKK